MSDTKTILYEKLFGCRTTLQNLLSKIEVLEKSDEITPEEIKKIREEITKVDIEIDTLKKAIKLLNTQNVN
jgi:hypothetical protein